MVPVSDAIGAVQMKRVYPGDKNFTRAFTFWKQCKDDRKYIEDMFERLYKTKV
jgi:hypothetical protein